MPCGDTGDPAVLILLLVMVWPAAGVLLMLIAVLCGERCRLSVRACVVVVLYLLTTCMRLRRTCVARPCVSVL